MNQTPMQPHLFASLPVPSQAEVMADIDRHAEFLFWSVKDPFVEFLQYRATDKNFADFTEDEAAQWLTIQAAHRAKGFFDGKPGVQVQTRHGKLIIVLDEKLSVTIKKLTVRRIKGKERVTRSNYLTRRNRKFHNQQTVDGVPSIPRVILGYILQKELTEIKVFIAYAKTRRRTVEWMSELTFERLVAPQVFAPQVATEDQTAAKGFVIGPAIQVVPEDKPTGTDTGAK
jgi:hypothetical protein